MIPMLLNQLSVVSARVTTPATGVWLADLDVDLDVTGVVPSGKAVLTIGTRLLTGTIDSRASGKFGSKAHVHLVGGGGGWDTTVPALHIHNDFGVLSTAIYSVTAASVGEVVVDAIPKRLGTDYARTAGPASRVLADVEWHVDDTGVTVIGPRLPIPFNPLEIEILEWDPGERKVTLASESLVVPGTILLDTRFGTATVRDIEQTFGPEGARATAFCATSDVPAVPGVAPTETTGSRLARALGALARHSVGREYLTRHVYRVAVQAADKRVTLQAIDPLGPVPLVLQDIEVWPGLCGSSSIVVPGTEVVVAFNDGDPTQPVVVGFAKSAPPPLETKMEAVRIALGSTAAEPVAKAPSTIAAINALQAQFAALAVWISANVGTSFSAVGMTGTAPALVTALGTGTTAVPAATTLIPSPKTFTD